MGFWLMDVNGENDVMDEIVKAINAGTNIDDIIDYLDNLVLIGKLTPRECCDLIKWAKEECL